MLSSSSESVLVLNLNPIKTAMLLMNYCNKIVEAYEITELRVKFIHDKLMESLRSILVNLYNPLEIKNQVMSKDIF